MNTNDIFHKRYKLEKCLGGGNFSEVWLAKDTLTGNVIRAIKIYTLDSNFDNERQDLFSREFAIVANINHTNLLTPLHYDICDDLPYLVLPYCEKGSILKYKGQFKELEAWKLIGDIADGLAYLHASNPPIIHQDVKPDNILIDDTGKYLLTDFGVSTTVKTTIQKTVIGGDYSSAGTKAYMAPERFDTDAEPLPLFANDVYSLGATVFEMLTGDVPFGDNGGMAQLLGGEKVELPGDFSDSLKDTVLKCLELKTWKRPKAQELSETARSEYEKLLKKPDGSSTDTENPVGRPTNLKNETKKEVDEQSKQSGDGSTKVEPPVPPIPGPDDSQIPSLWWGIAVVGGLALGALAGYFI